SGGGVSLYSGWPGWTDGGGVYGIAFDTRGNFGGKMFTGNSFKASNSSISGLFVVDSGNSVSRFCDGLVSAGGIAFDKTGIYFDGDMFVSGRDSFEKSNSLWRVKPNGTCQEFMTGVRSFTFGDDGAMYVSSYNWGADMVDISRVTPEPATLLLLTVGGLVLRRRNKNDQRHV
ncbi:MAG: PEP-CTERM sorting domain-containing protein, partial [bacterium]|nr:PEP-CTERM sorting domain-containing protein [bacterium]